MYDPAGMARQLVEKAGYQEPVQPVLEAIASIPEKDLYCGLADEKKKKAFWLNLYNGVARMRLRSAQRLYGSKEFFKGTSVLLAGRNLSLDEIENIYIRRAEPSFLPRFIRPLFMTAFARRLSIERIDPRLHFALNCGARSCPPVLAYDEKNLDAQLDAATAHYLKSSVIYDHGAGRVELPELFKWYYDDFGGRSGILTLLRKYDIIGLAANPAFVYTSWDWSPDPGMHQ